MDDEAIKLVRISLMVVVPILIFYLGYKFLRKIEDTKNSSSAGFGASAKRANAILESHDAYRNEVLSLLSDTDLLLGQLQAGSQNSDNSLVIQERMNSAKPKVHRAAVKLFGCVSDVSNNSEEIQESTDKGLSLVKKIFNTKEYKRDEIYQELTRLRKSVEDTQKQIISKPT